MKFGYIGYIPANVRYNDDLTTRDKLVYCEITANLDEKGICTKNNIHFAKVLNSSKNTISTCISKLRDHGYINTIIEKEQGTNKFLKRYISLLPYTENSVGVNDQDLDPYTEKSVGVSGSSDASAVDNQSKGYTDKSKLSYNNKIIYKYSNNKSKDSIYPEINDKQMAFLKKIAVDFYTRKAEQYPEITIVKQWESDKDLMIGSINTLYDLIKIDKWDEKVVRDVIRWATDDKFWSVNLLSLRSLRVISNNGQNKFANIYTRYKG